MFATVGKRLDLRHFPRHGSRRTRQKIVDDPWQSRYFSAEPTNEIEMAQSRKKKPPAAAANRIPTPPVAIPPVAVPPVRLLTAYAGGDEKIVLLQDTGRGLLLIASGTPGMPLHLDAPNRAFLRENDFAEEARNGPWIRPINREASFQDRIDAERVLLKIAEKLRGDGEIGRAGRRSR